MFSDNYKRQNFGCVKGLVQKKSSLILKHLTSEANSWPQSGHAGELVQAITVLPFPYNYRSPQGIPSDFPCFCSFPSGSFRRSALRLASIVFIFPVISGL